MGYECLLTGLPELVSGGSAPMTDEALQTLLSETLKEKDLEDLKLLNMRSDDPIILALCAQYDDTIIGQPSWWEDVREQLSEEDLRTQVLYKYGRTHGCRFVREWFGFNQDVNNVLAAAICRKHGLDVRKVIVGTNEVAQILRKGLPQKDFGLGGILDNLQEILALVDIANLMEREKSLDALRFMWLEDKTRFINFSTENVLAYWLQNKMLNRWAVLTVEEGEKVFREMVADMKKGVRLDA